MKTAMDYSDKQLQIFIRILNPLGWLLIVLSLFILPIGVVTLIFGIFVLLVCKSYKKIIIDRNIVSDSSTEDNSKQKRATMNYDLFSEFDSDNVLTYQYEESISLNKDIDLSQIKGGNGITFQPEPTNEYDNKAIKIMYDNIFLGYVYKGQVQDMIHDWIKKDLPFEGYINKIFDDEYKVTYKIAFYKNLDAFESKEYSISKTGKKIDDYTKRSDNLELCSEGDNVIIDYDEYDEVYVLMNENYEEIGELSQSISRNLFGKYKKLCGKISSIEYNENDKIKAKVIVYFMK